MYLVDGTVVTSASDLKKASECEFAFLRALDAKLGRIEPVPDPEDAMLERSGRMGDEHEHRVLEAYRAELGSAVVEIERPDVRDAAAVRAAVERHARRVRGGGARRVPGHVRRRGLHRLRRLHRAAARRPVPRAGLQARPAGPRHRAAAARGLRRAARARRRAVRRHGRAPARRRRRPACTASTTSRPCTACAEPGSSRSSAERLADDGPVAWGDPRYELDGRCPTCDLEVQAHRDVLLVAGLRTTQRAALLEAGIDDDRRARGLRAARCPASSTPRSRTSASRRACSSRPRPLRPSPMRRGCARPTTRRSRRPWSCATPCRSRRSPSPTPATCSSTSRAIRSTPRARDRLGPRLPLRHGRHRRAVHAALGARLRRGARGARAVPRARRRAPRGASRTCTSTTTRAYERTHLLAIAARHGVRRGGGRPAARRRRARRPLPDRARARCGSAAARTRSRSSSRSTWATSCARRGDRRAATRSLEYVERASARRDAGSTGHAAAAQRSILDDLADYNRYDCVSTLRLRDWLLGIAREAGVEPRARTLLVEAAKAAGKVYEASPLAIELQRLAGPPDDPDRDADHTALALAAAAIDYHDREAKSFWWSHFFRVEQPLESWEDHRDVLVVDPAASAVVQRLVPRRPAPRRSPRAAAARAGRPGVAVQRAAARLFVLYDSPAPFPRQGRAPAGSRHPERVRVLEVLDDGLVVEERSVDGVHLGPSSRWPSCPARRRRRAGSARRSTSGRRSSRASPAPGRRTRDRHAAPHRRRARATARPPRGARRPTDDVRRARSSPRRSTLDDSYLAVQGPPGTGKTYVGSPRHRPARRAARVEGRRRRAVPRRRREHARRASSRPGSTRELVGKAPKTPRDAGDPACTVDHERRRTPKFPPSTPAPASWSAAPHGTSRNDDRVAARQPRPARDRRGRPVLARRDDRRLASRAATCCCSATRSSCRR